MTPHCLSTLLKVQTHRRNERGNILFIVLLAIALIGALAIAIQSGSNSESAQIDDEGLAIKATEVQRFASELERAVLFIARNEVSESDIRFAHPDAHADYGDLSADSDPTNQVFHEQGGGATYRTPPSSINNGDSWEFYGNTALPNVGSGAADLVAVLPNVTQQFCDKINALNNQSSQQPTDSGSVATTASNAGSCVHAGAVGRFDSGTQFYDTPNTTDSASFTTLPAKQACVQCTDMTGAPYHFYHVIMAR